MTLRHVVLGLLVVIGSLLVHLAIFLYPFLPPPSHELISDIELYSTPKFKESLPFVWRGGTALSVYHPPDPDLVYFSVINPDTRDFFTDAAYIYRISSRQLTATTITQLGIEGEARWTSVLGMMTRKWYELACEVDGRVSVSLRGPCVAAAGRSLVRLQYSPSGNLAAVVTADGGHPKPRWTPFGPGTTTNDAYGQHYLQFIPVEIGAFVGEPIRIAIETARSVGRIDWLSDDLLVVAHPAAEWISIVHVSDVFAGNESP
ncbi:MAG: hypothetical protein O3A53_11610 [Acidobacteria bacterium]|nr:hypothetical protein [Acidobacteriota bacterium]MDA1235437.1 hypothetical protein [Acidobacteriota bacterium]